MERIKLARVTTVPISLKLLLKGQHKFMQRNGFNVIGISSYGPELDEIQNEEKIRVKDIEMTRNISPFKDLKSLWSLYKFFKQEKPLIVHTHTPKAGVLGMLAAKICGVPIRLHTVAGMPLMEASGIKREVLDIVEKITYWAATKIYPNSKELERFILNYGYCFPDKVKVIANGSSNGVDTSFFFSRSN